MINGNWINYGLVFQPNSNLSWMQSHAQLPTILRLNDKLVRIYFAGRNKEQKSHIGFFDFDLQTKKTINYSMNPVLLPEKIGFFDSDGVYPSSVVEINDKIYLYYIGWIKGAIPPLFYAGIGLAISQDGGNTFKKYSKAPILSRGIHDPCFVTAPNVFCEGSKFKMIYTSGIKWEFDKNRKLTSFYDLKESYSNDGINWNREGLVVVGLKDKERNISRSNLISFKNGTQLLLYGVSSSKSPYQIKYSIKDTNGKWVRSSNVIPRIILGMNDFDSNTMSYPSSLWYENKIYMFYNGNNFGKDGVGLRVLEKISYLK